MKITHLIVNDDNANDFNSETSVPITKSTSSLGMFCMQLNQVALSCNDFKHLILHYNVELNGVLYRYYPAPVSMLLLKLLITSASTSLSDWT